MTVFDDEYAWSGIDDDDEFWFSEEDADRYGGSEPGCVFPNECCMHGLHLVSECFTAEMAELWAGEFHDE